MTNEEILRIAEPFLKDFGNDCYLNDAIPKNLVVEFVRTIQSEMFKGMKGVLRERKTKNT